MNRVYIVIGEIGSRIFDISARFDSCEAPIADNFQLTGKSGSGGHLYCEACLLSGVMNGGKTGSEFRKSKKLLLTHKHNSRTPDRLAMVSERVGTRKQP